MVYKYVVDFNCYIPFGICLGLFLIIGLENAVTRLLTFVKGMEI